jgi:hypothetical protein
VSPIETNSGHESPGVPVNKEETPGVLTNENEETPSDLINDNAGDEEPSEETYNPDMWTPSVQQVCGVCPQKKGSVAICTRK